MKHLKMGKKVKAVQVAGIIKNFESRVSQHREGYIK